MDIRSITAKTVAISSIFLALSTTQAADSCDAIITHGLRNIQVSKSSEAAIATKYFNHCQKQFSSMSDQELAQASLEIIGKGSGGASYDRKRTEERLNQWCTDNRELAQSNKTAFNESQEIYQGAVSAWEKCTALYARGVQITPSITPDARTIGIGLVYKGDTNDGVLFYGVRAEDFKCQITGPGGSTVKLPAQVGAQSWQINCQRTKPTQITRDGQTYDVLPRGTIYVETASNPFQLFFPEEYDPGAPMKELQRLRNQVRASEIPVGTVISSAMNYEQFTNSRNPGYTKEKWLPADGQTLPPGTLYETITGQRNAPDLTAQQTSHTVLDVVNIPKKHGENTISGVSTAGSKGEWKWFVGPRDIQGQRYNNDYEQAPDNFQSYINDSGVIIAQGTTFNFKHGRWGNWMPGEANLLGISLLKNKLYYYVKVN